LPECVEESEKESGLNPSYLEQGVPLCPPECVPASEQELGANPSFLASGVPLCPEQTTGYEYPPPDNPLTLPTKPTPAITTTTEYFPTLDYDPDDIPSDQAKPLPLCVPVEEETSPESQDFLSAGVPLCPSEETDLPGYEPTEPSYDDYDVNDVPPDQAAPLPDCVKAEDKDKAPNPSYIEQGVELCPEEQGYSYPVPDNPLVLPQKIRKSKFLLEDLGVEMGVSVARGGRVFSFHLPGQAEVSDMTVTGGKTEQSESNELQAESGTGHQARRGRILTDNKEKQKPRGGKILKESKKSGGTRTISVREWLRRGR